jgi:homoserine kinase
MSQKPDRAIVFAPATVANVAVGFDILGFAMGVVGDRVTATRTADPGQVTIESITGVVTELPKDPKKNTATVAVQALITQAQNEGRALSHGFSIAIEKGISLGSGMGGSAASAVGAVVAANALLEQPFSKEQLLEFALAGEEIASGSRHADNVAPCLYGGLVLVPTLDPLRVVFIPVPQEINCVLIHPHLRIDTREARALLKPEIALSTHVRQSGMLAGLIAGCFKGDFDLIGNSLKDLMIEPQRSILIPGFKEAKEAALEQGALGFSISGSGPSLFAWTASKNAAERVRSAVLRVFEARGTGADGWANPMSVQGARIVG